MLKQIISILFILLIFTREAPAQNFYFEQTYILKIPDVNIEKCLNYAANIKSYQVQLIKLDNHSFILVPLPGTIFKRWIQSLKEPLKDGWRGEIEGNGDVTITGIIASGNAYSILILKGRHDNRTGAISGEAVFEAGFAGSDKIFYSFKTQWGMVQLENEDILNISPQVTYHGPEMPAPIVSEVTTKEEEAKRPIENTRTIKQFAHFRPHQQKRILKANRRNTKLMHLYDTILSELTWEEMKYVPGILLLIDHLAALDKNDQKRIAEAYVRDGTMDMFGDISYRELQKIPQLFLVLRSINQIKPEDLNGLKNESPRFLILFTAHQEIHSGELNNLTMEQFVARISEHLSEKFREQYFNESGKLRALVAATDIDLLKELYPFPAND